MFSVTRFTLISVMSMWYRLITSNPHTDWTALSRAHTSAEPNNHLKFAIVYFYRHSLRA